MKTEYWLSSALLMLVAALLALAWWGWGRSGLAFMQLGLGAC
ncbi:hypothetical protein PH586_19365 [Pseudomonas sp. SA3-5]|uniref:Uncharacterized protein n=1 Tax=Pseudomonas aestuarii TaxID=3018340 RepID=A0ABT4XK13_9PSED|nr:hypothetical protein [Pseudomonas aestuarii]MDA7088544.1 hypothetical protein [Pseudomonas aestuarii]